MERAKRTLELELLNARDEITDLEDALQKSEDDRLRLEVNLQSVKADLNRIAARKECDDDEKNSTMQRRVNFPQCSLFLPLFC